MATINIIQTNLLYTPVLKIPIYVGYYHNKVCFIELGPPNAKKLEEWAMVKAVERKYPGYSFSPDYNLHKDTNDEIIKMVDDSNSDNFNYPIIYLIGTPFQKKVWKALTKIPRGETRTYADIAEMVGSPNAVRAMGTAIGKNSHAVFIPCHRVIPKSGGIGQYKWGTDLKSTFLEIEKNA